MHLLSYHLLFLENVTFLIAIMIFKYLDAMACAATTEYNVQCRERLVNFSLYMFGQILRLLNEPPGTVQKEDCVQKYLFLF